MTRCYVGTAGAEGAAAHDEAADAGTSKASAANGSASPPQPDDEDKVYESDNLEPWERPPPDWPPGPSASSQPQSDSSPAQAPPTSRTEGPPASRTEPVRSANLRKRRVCPADSIHVHLNGGVPFATAQTPLYIACLRYRLHILMSMGTMTGDSRNVMLKTTPLTMTLKTVTTTLNRQAFHAAKLTCPFA